MIVLSTSLSERKRILKDICRRHGQWKWRIALATVLILLAVGIMSYFVVVLINNSLPILYSSLMLLVAMMVACVPFFVALSVKNTAKYKCAFPYTSYANGTVFLYDDKLEYIFWLVGIGAPAAYSSKRAAYRDEDKIVYSISKQDISSIDIREDICSIKGAGTVYLPEDLNEAEWDKYPLFVQMKKEFSFILAFEQENSEQIIKEWKRSSGVI